MLGNVSELTETPLTVPLDGAWQLDATRRIVLGDAWDAATRNRGLDGHFFEDTADAEANHRVGFRCASSIP